MLLMGPKPCVQYLYRRVLKLFKTHVLNKYILLNIEVKNYQVLERGMYKAGEGNGTPLQYSCLENPMEEPGRLQSMGSLRVGYD